MSTEKSPEAGGPVEAPVSDPELGGIARRTLLQSIVGGLGAGLAAPALVNAQAPPHTGDHAKVATARKKATAAGTYTPEFLDEHQLQTLAAMAERIVPGSTAAKVAPYIDQMLAVDTQDNQKSFFGSMGAFEMLAVEKHSKPWKALSAAEADELLTMASTAESGRTTPRMMGDPRRATGFSGKLTIRDHFENLKGWISGAYYSSEAGMKELGWTGQLFFEKLPGCEHPDGHA